MRQRLGLSRHLRGEARPAPLSQYQSLFGPDDAEAYRAATLHIYVGWEAGEFRFQSAATKTASQRSDPPAPVALVTGGVTFFTTGCPSGLLFPA